MNEAKSRFRKRLRAAGVADSEAYRALKRGKKKKKRGKTVRETPTESLVELVALKSGSSFVECEPTPEAQQLDGFREERVAGRVSEVARLQLSCLDELLELHERQLKRLEDGVKSSHCALLDSAAEKFKIRDVFRCDASPAMRHNRALLEASQVIAEQQRRVQRAEAQCRTAGCERWALSASAFCFKR